MFSWEIQSIQDFCLRIGSAVYGSSLPLWFCQSSDATVGRKVPCRLVGNSPPAAVMQEKLHLSQLRIGSMTMDSKLFSASKSSNDSIMKPELSKVMCLGPIGLILNCPA